MSRVYRRLCFAGACWRSAIFSILQLHALSGYFLAIWQAAVLVGLDGMGALLACIQAFSNLPIGGFEKKVKNFQKRAVGSQDGRGWPQKIRAFLGLFSRASPAPRGLLALVLFSFGGAASPLGVA